MIDAKDVWTRCHKRDELCKKQLMCSLAQTSGQGTTEYAILVGVLVVIAILSIIAFKGKVQELWDAIRDGIQQL